MDDYVSKWVSHVVKLPQKNPSRWLRVWFPSLWYPKNFDKRWRNTLHWEELQEVLVQIRDWT
jgi:hypothetical protein